MSIAQLKRSLGFWDVFFIAVGQIIGAGVIALTGIAIGMTGPGVVLAYLASAVLVIVVTLLIMMAGASLPVVGAYYAWSARLGGGWLGSLVLWLTLLASISLSLYGSSFGLYLEPVFGLLDANQWGIVVVTLLCIGNLFGLTLASGVQRLLVFVLLSALALYAGFAAPNIDAAKLSPMLPSGWLGFLTAVFLLKFATSGAYMVVGLGSEIRNPHRVIPIVMTTATLFVAVLYAGVAAASVGVVDWREMIDQPLTVAGEVFMPGWALTYFLLAGAGLAICTTLNAQFIQLPRTFMLASWDGLLPAWIGRLNRYGAPHVILLAMLAVGIVPLVANLEIGEIARVASIAANLPPLIVYWVVLRIPETHPQQYQRSGFRFSKRTLWTLFVISEGATLAGIYLLARDLPISVILTVVVWVGLAIAYYPLRRAYVARQGINLDAQVTDAAIFKGQ